MASISYKRVENATTTAAKSNIASRSKTANKSTNSSSTRGPDCLIHNVAKGDIKGNGAETL